MNIQDTMQGNGFVFRYATCAESGQEPFMTGGLAKFTAFDYETNYGTLSCNGFSPSSLPTVGGLYDLTGTAHGIPFKFLGYKCESAGETSTFTGNTLEAYE